MRMGVCRGGGSSSLLDVSQKIWKPVWKVLTLYFATCSSGMLLPKASVSCVFIWQIGYIRRGHIGWGVRSGVQFVERRKDVLYILQFAIQTQTRGAHVLRLLRQRHQHESHGKRSMYLLQDQRYRCWGLSQLHRHQLLQPKEMGLNMSTSHTSPDCWRRSIFQLFSLQLHFSLKPIQSTVFSIVQCSVFAKGKAHDLPKGGCQKLLSRSFPLRGGGTPHFC